MSAPLDALPADALAMGTIHGKTVQVDPLTNAPALFVYQRTSSKFANHTSATHPRLQLRREPGGKKATRHGKNNTAPCFRRVLLLTKT